MAEAAAAVVIGTIRLKIVAVAAAEEDEVEVVIRTGHRSTGTSKRVARTGIDATGRCCPS